MLRVIDNPFVQMVWLQICSFCDVFPILEEFNCSLIHTLCLEDFRDLIYFGVPIYIENSCWPPQGMISSFIHLLILFTKNMINLMLLKFFIDT